MYHGIKINFDNGGSIQIWNRHWAHDYMHPEQAAKDMDAILQGADPASDFDGNDQELRQALNKHSYSPHPTDRQYRAGQIASLMQYGAIEISDDEAVRIDGLFSSGFAEDEFWRALMKAEPRRKSRQR